MNKQLLLIAAVATAYALLRSKSNTALVQQAGTSALASGAASYVPVASTTTNAATGSNWLSTVASGVATGAGIVKTGISIYDDVRGVFTNAQSTNTAPTTASVTSDAWAEPSYVTS